jgi:ERCC4-type nuclease
LILVDNRAGSKELIDPLEAAGLPVEVTMLDFGDLCWVGRGANGTGVLIGVEYKKLPDLVQSLATERLAGHQLPGMVQTYDRPYLLIEGAWDADESGRVVQPGAFRGASNPLKGCPPAIELLKRIFTLETRGGLRVHWTQNQKATVRYITALYRFWTDKALDQHKSHLAVHAPDLDPSLKDGVSDFARVVAMIPGIGFTTAVVVDKVFGSSFTRMMAATEQEWAAIEINGRKLGANKAHKIKEMLK